MPLSTVRLNAWAAALGCFMALLARLYGRALEAAVALLWTDLPAGSLGDWLLAGTGQEGGQEIQQLGGAQQIGGSGSAMTNTGPEYTLLVCAGGGLVVGLLALVLPPAPGVGEWIAATAHHPPWPGGSSLPGQGQGQGGFKVEHGVGGSRLFEGGLLRLGAALARVLLPALVTSACGFSLGPEAPMVRMESPPFKKKSTRDEQAQAQAHA